MGLFQRRTEIGTNAPLYTNSLTRSLVIVGLGNPGAEYDGTRHNVGFAVLDKLARDQDFPAWISKKDLQADITQTTLGGNKVLLVKPTTFMNLSGEALQKVLHFYKYPLKDVVVVHDELDIPFGQIRLRRGGSAAGHNGIKDIITHCGEDFGRIRIGIGGETKMQTSDYVLAPFTKDEQSHFNELQVEAQSILTEYIFSGELRTETRQFIF